MYTEASSPRSHGQDAVLLSPYFDVYGGECLTFWANMYGSSIGSLVLYEEVRYDILCTQKQNSFTRTILLPRELRWKLCIAYNYTGKHR